MGSLTSQGPKIVSDMYGGRLDSVVLQWDLYRLNTPSTTSLRVEVSSVSRAIIDPLCPVGTHDTFSPCSDETPFFFVGVCSFLGTLSSIIVLQGET